MVPIMKKLLFIFGTRPEAIKLAPLIKQFQKETRLFETLVCVTGQHREMLDQVLNFFKIKPNIDLNLMKINQTIFDITGSDAFRKLEKYIDSCAPDIIFVQGDTTTAFLSALTGYYKKIKIAHIEAGLRTYNKYSPFPEEMNRRLIDHISDYLFPSTKDAQKNLSREGITDNVWVVGNTVIDAVYSGLDVIKKYGQQEYLNHFRKIDFSKKVILVTAHRRENFGQPIINIAQAIKEIATTFKNIEIVYPVHPNPNIQNPVYNILKNIPNCHLIDPLNYSHMIWLMNRSYFIMTDSGGIQEEALTLGKPILVLRDSTEREEGIKVKASKLVGTNKDTIIANATSLLTNLRQYQAMSTTINPYGDGKSCSRIVKIIKNL